MGSGITPLYSIARLLRIKISGFGVRAVLRKHLRMSRKLHDLRIRPCCGFWPESRGSLRGMIRSAGRTACLSLCDRLAVASPLTQSELDLCRRNLPQQRPQRRGGAGAAGGCAALAPGRPPPESVCPRMAMSMPLTPSPAVPTCTFGTNFCALARAAVNTSG